MKVKALVKELLNHDMEEEVFFILYNNEHNTFIYYPDVEVGVLKDKEQEYTTLFSKSMSKDLYENPVIEKVLKVLDDRIEYRKKQVGYFDGNSEENHHDCKIILDELLKIKEWI